MPNWVYFVFYMSNIWLSATYNNLGVGRASVEDCSFLCPHATVFLSLLSNTGMSTYLKLLPVLLWGSFLMAASPHPCLRGRDIFTAALYWSERALITIMGYSDQARLPPPRKMEAAKELPSNGHSGLLTSHYSPGQTPRMKFGSGLWGFHVTL